MNPTSSEFPTSLQVTVRTTTEYLDLGIKKWAGKLDNGAHLKAMARSTLLPRSITRFPIAGTSA